MTTIASTLYLPYSIIYRELCHVFGDLNFCIWNSNCYFINDVCSYNLLQGSGVLGSKVMKGMVFRREVEGKIINGL